MSQILTWLSEGDLRSDGLSKKAVAIVLRRLDRMADMIEGLDPAVRNRSNEGHEVGLRRLRRCDVNRGVS